MTIDRYVAAAGVVGLANVAAVFAGAFVVRSLTDDGPWLPVVPFLALAAVATFALGAGPVYALLRYRLVLPLVLSGRATYLAATGAANAQHDFVEVYFIPPFVLALLGFVATVGALEYGVRAWSGMAEPEPLV